MIHIFGIFFILGVFPSTPVSSRVYEHLELDSIVVFADDNGKLKTDSYRHPQNNYQLNETYEAVERPAGFGIQDNCGNYSFRENTDARVVGGREALLGEFPYSVALMKHGRRVRKEYQFCGGSLISDQWVLTAAHCITQHKKDFSAIYVHVGVHHVYNQSDVGRQTRRVKKGMYHRNFSIRTLQHDIALLQLDKPVVFGDRVQPVCLSNQEPPFGEKAVLAGWGKMGVNRPQSPVLRTVTMNILGNDKCRQAYAPVQATVPRITENMDCASEKYPLMKDACHGDSGGPLVTLNSNKTLQIALVSWGKDCGAYPGVYTRVDKYLDWIEKNTK